MAAALTLDHLSRLQASRHLSLPHRTLSSFPRNPVKNPIFRQNLAESSSFRLSTVAVKALSTVAVEDSSEKKMVKGIRVYEHGGPEVSQSFDF